MQNQTVARRYASAIFSLAQDRAAIEDVGRDLHVAQAAIAGDPDAGRFFVSPVFDRSEKLKIVGATFEGRLSEVALHALLLLVRKRREALLQAIVAEYDALQLAQSGLEPLEITSAQELPPHELSELVERLSRVYSKRFKVSKRVDPTLLGGLRITMGDRRIDGSIAGRLDDLARDLHTVKSPTPTSAAP